MTDSMEQTHQVTPDAQWLADRAEALATANRARQQELQAQFEQRHREDEATARMLVGVILFFFVCVLFLVATFLPMAWDALRHYWQAYHPSMGLVAVVVALPRMPVLAKVLTCRYCGADIPVTGPPQPLTEALVERHSEGCHCRVSTRILNGLLAGNAVALLTFETFKMRWHLGLGVPQEQAQDNCRLLCRVPLSETFAEAVNVELQRRSDVVRGKRED